MKNERPADAHDAGLFRGSEKRGAQLMLMMLACFAATGKGASS